MKPRTVRFAPKLDSRVAKEAKKQKRSFSKTVEILVEEALKNKKDE